MTVFLSGKTAPSGGVCSVYTGLSHFDASVTFRIRARRLDDEVESRRDVEILARERKPSFIPPPSAAALAIVTEGKWPLGGDLPVSRIGYGAMKLTGWPRGERPDREVALAVLRRALELGVNHIDTSNYYARDGVSANELIRSALHPYPSDLVIVTKVGALVEGADIALPAPEMYGLTRDGLRRGVEANLRSLGVDRLDVVNLRMNDRGHEGLSPKAALEHLLALREEGLIHHLGISNVSASQLAEARALTPIVCVQNAYNLSRRDDDALVDSCARDGIAYVPYFPVGGPRPLAVERLDRVAARIGATAHQVALAWLLARSPNILPIPGTTSIAHLEQNVAASRITLSTEELAELG